MAEWRRLNFEQRAAAVGALLLIVSTFGPFSFVEAAEVAVGLAVLVLLRQRARERSFHLPFGDGTVILAAGCWAAGLVAVRLFDRPLGQNLLALACAAVLVLAGARERARRPPDDLPATRS
jgi:drug/metabolite transporter (DMT)-like permease